MNRIDWDLAGTVARRLAGQYPLEGTYHEDILAARAPELVARAGRLVAAETGLVADGEPDVVIVGRAGWIDANLGSFAALLAPLERRLSERTGLGAHVTGRVMAAELGVVLGILARRVLGQYEMVLPAPGRERGDTVLLVGGNLMELERRHALRPDEFRFWVALHEATHRAQFRGVPWLRDHFLGLVGDLVAAGEPEPGRVGRIVAEMREAAAAGEPLVGEAGLFGLFAPPRQRQVLERIQALMALLEGHGHVVMDRIGRRELLTQARMSQILKLRRADPRTAALMRLLGLEMKLRQYELGERFVLAVERSAGWPALDRAWEGPDRLPTLEEIEEPERWLHRTT